jgi:hypothetical protein
MRQRISSGPSLVSTKSGPCNKILNFSNKLTAKTMPSTKRLRPIKGNKNRKKSKSQSIKLHFSKYKLKTSSLRIATKERISKSSKTKNLKEKSSKNLKEKSSKNLKERTLKKC